ncbi:MAG: dTDP-4-dehydrorhamnose 3,5-epimerase family protein [Candidatus Micrarchaeota archaeon]|nr:dTDP-4-dehydrorhamnose 3,5-epimerase family protein [Candidatus Micrarchaeota archaeon]
MTSEYVETSSIAGVDFKALRQIKDERGFLMEILRGSDIFKADGKAFGQVYLSTVKPKVIKGKHLHHLQTDHMTVIRGLAALHLEDGRENSPTKGKKEVILMGEGHFKCVKIPPYVWHSFENVGDEECYFINYVTREYDRAAPDEFRGPFDLKDKKMKGDPVAMG